MPAEKDEGSVMDFLELERKLERLEGLYGRYFTEALALEKKLRRLKKVEEPAQPVMSQTELKQQLLLKRKGQLVIMACPQPCKQTRAARLNDLQKRLMPDLQVKIESLNQQLGGGIPLT